MGLVLSRKVNETIQIGANIVVQIVDVRGDRVRLRIEAPEDVELWRGEVFERIRRERELSQRQAGGGDG